MWFDIHIVPFCERKTIFRRNKRIKEVYRIYENTKTEKRKTIPRFSILKLRKSQRLIDWIDAQQILTSPIAMKILQVLIEHDPRRKTNLLNTFPEMEDFWEECKWTE